MYSKMSKRICRLCLGDERVVCNIFEHQIEDLPQKVGLCTSIEFFSEDRTPNDVCLTCIDTVTQFDLFRKTCLRSNEIFKARHSNCEETFFVDVFNTHETDSSDECNSDYDVIREDFKDLVTKRGKTYEIDDMIREIIGENVYKCDICSKEFLSFFEYHDHQEVHNGALVFKCSKCNEVFSTRQDFVDHDGRHKIPCRICKLEVLPKSMLAHLLIHTDAHRCSYCGMRHTSKASLEKHIKARHAGIRGFVCHICGKQSSCQSSMNRHMGYHSTERPYNCKHCNFNAKSLNIVQVHTARKHFAEKCVCEICAKLFKSQPSLNQHMKRIHTTRKHVCNICDKAFIERYNLSKHMKRHAGQRLHECKLCNKEFFTVRKLKDHMHSHRQGCVSCPTCGKEFFYKKYYSKHIAKCTEIKREDFELTT